MIILTILAVTMSAMLILSTIAVGVGGSALIIAFGDIILYGLGIYIILRLIINAFKNKKEKETKTKKTKKK